MARPRSLTGRYVEVSRVGTRRLREHTVVAERALGHQLPVRAVVHHVNGNGRDNRNQNLVICQDRRYHTLLHRRERILKAGGNPDGEQICHDCRRVLPLAAFHRNRSDPTGHCHACKPCHLAACRRLFRKRRAA